MKLDLFIRDWCPWCIKALHTLDQLGFTYEIHDIEKNPSDAALMVKISNQQRVPTLSVNDLVLADFGPEELINFLKKHKISPAS